MTSKVSAENRVDGIAQLHLAEQQAEEKIQQARERKIKRLRQAKDEAKYEVEKYKEERHREFQVLEGTVCGSKTEFETFVNEMMSTQLTQLSKSVGMNRDRALQNLLSTVFDITPELHVNYTAGTVGQDGFA